MKFLRWILPMALAGAWFCGTGRAVALPLQGATAPKSLPAPTLLSPANGADLQGYPRILNLQWSEVPGASSYTIEIDCLGCCVKDGWCSGSGKPTYIIKDLEVPGFSFSFWGDQPGRWRVWAKAPTGDGNMSEWREFTFRSVQVPPTVSGEVKTAAKSDCSWRSSLVTRPGTSAPMLIEAPQPEYDKATKERINSVVSMEVKVGVNGQVENVCILHSPRADLDEASIRAVNRWRFSPARSEGAAVPGITHLEIRFRACCDQAVLHYPEHLEPPKTMVAQAEHLSGQIANSPCPAWPSSSPGTTLPKALYHPEPEFTDAARKNKLSGYVVLFVKIGADGKVEDVCVAKSLRADLDDSAVRTVKTWRFEPAQRNGVAVAAATSVEVGFYLY
jgi:TonB family protein